MSRRMMLVRAGAGGGGGGSNGFYRAITPDATKAGASDSSNFPVLVCGTYGYLATVANGGKVNGVEDIRFYSDSGLTTLMDFKILRWDATTGFIVARVKQATLSHTSGVAFYMAYGKAADTADVGTTAVYSNSYEVALALENGTTLALTDATSHARNATEYNSSGIAAPGTVTAGTAKVGGGAVFDGSHLIAVDYNGTALTTATIEFWVKTTTNGSVCGVFEWQFAGSFIGGNRSGNPFVLVQNDNGNLKIYVDGSYRETSQTLSTNTWYKITVTLSASSVWKFYLGATLLSTYTGGVSNQSFARYANWGSGFNGFLTGLVDEAAISSVTRAADWVTAMYNNENDPSTFYSVGSEVAR